MKKDIPDLISRDRNLNVAANPNNDTVQSNDINIPNNLEYNDKTLLSEDMRRELLRQKWEKEEEENLKKTKLHYKDVLFDEARTHGAAFYNFSRSEMDRANEMENLKEMHKETEKARESRNDISAKRKSAMEIRLKKVRDRKRLKLGLPVLEDENETSKQFPDDAHSIEPKEVSFEDTVMESLRKMRDD